MPEINLKEFDERLNSMECSQAIREIVAALRKAAEQAGPTSWIAHSGSGGGWGIRGKRDRRLVCQFDPKPTALHVCAQVPGADERELKAAGTVHLRKNGSHWVDVRDVQGAKTLEPLIARAYAEAGADLSRPASRR